MRAMPSPSSPAALVLGAGIMGLSAAWALSRAGFAVRVVEQDLVPNPRGSSVDDHRLIRHAYGAQSGYMRMVDAAYAAWGKLWREMGGEAPYVPTGVLALSSVPGGWLEQSLTALTADGRAVEALDPAAVAARFPMLDTAGVARAFHTAPGGVLLARRIVAGLAALLDRRGVTVLRAQAVAVDPLRGALLLADGRSLSADLLVVAAGPWAPRLLPEALAGRVRPTRQIVVYLDPPEAHRAAWARAPMLLDLAEDGGFYAVPPVAGTPLKIGDHRFAPHGDPDDPREASAAEAKAILSLARPRLHDAGAYRVLGARACYYDVEPGERFLLEALSPRAMVMSGFSGHGFKFGALLGLAVACAAKDAAKDAPLGSGIAAWAAGEAPPPAGLLAELEEEDAAS
jgi:sarcosine oxidase subunit beta